MDKRDKNRKGQIHLSFGMIFSIILIIIFIGFAFFAIQKFLGLQDSIKLNKFYDTLQNDINIVWNSAQTTQEKSYDIPAYIGKICFVGTGDNMLIYGTDNIPKESRNIENLNILAMTSEGSLCFENLDGKVDFVLEKKFTDTLVTIKK